MTLVIYPWRPYNEMKSSDIRVYRLTKEGRNKLNEGTPLEQLARGMDYNIRVLKLEDFIRQRREEEERIYQATHIKGRGREMTINAEKAARRKNRSLQSEVYSDTLNREKRDDFVLSDLQKKELLSL